MKWWLLGWPKYVFSHIFRLVIDSPRSPIYTVLAEKPTIGGLLCSGVRATALR